MMAPGIASGFVRKLYRILDSEDQAIIGWELDRKAFSIYDKVKLDTNILPLYFRGKLCAFRQQLLDHGFVRLHLHDSSEIESYQHVHFVKGQPASLDQIIRIPIPKSKKKNRKESAKKEPKYIGMVSRTMASPYPVASRIIAVKPTTLPKPGSAEELIWKALTLFANSTDEFSNNAFSPPLLALATGNAIGNEAMQMPNPLFEATTTNTNPLFSNEPSMFPDCSVLDDPFDTPFNAMNHSLDIGATAPNGTTTNEINFLSPNPLFDTKANHDSEDDDHLWNLLTTSSVDRLHKSVDDFRTPEETLKFIVQERDRLAMEREKRNINVNANFVNPFPSLGGDNMQQNRSSNNNNALPTFENEDALWKFLMSSSIDVIQKSVDDLELQNIENRVKGL